MKVSTTFVLDRDDLNKMIPYPMICETRFGKDWDLSRVKMRYKEEFTPAERNLAVDLFRKAHRWFLVTGVPEETRMSSQEFTLWLKLGEFCASI